MCSGLYLLRLRRLVTTRAGVGLRVVAYEAAASAWADQPLPMAVITSSSMFHGLGLKAAGRDFITSLV